MEATIQAAIQQYRIGALTAHELYLKIGQAILDCPHKRVSTEFGDFCETCGTPFQPNVKET